MRFQGKCVLITGAGSGLGEACALGFAEEGAAVVVNDVDAKKAESTADKILSRGQQAVYVRGDVARIDDVEQMVARGVKEFGQIDILVNNAGIVDPIATPTEEQDVDQWQRVIDVNLRGSYLCSKVVGKGMIEHRYGKIVNISSIAGMVGLPRRNAYGPAKAGIIMLTRVLASEWAKYGINVNAVAPGYIMTPLVQEYNAMMKSDRSKELKKRIPFGRLGEPKDIYNAVSFLAADGSGYITGTCLPVDGGWTAFGDCGDAFEL